MPKADHAVNPASTEPALSVVVIGRNEGERLRRCLDSVRRIAPPEGGLELIYVDSRSTDGSVEVARQAGAQVVILDTGRPTAGAARNAGWQLARAQFILFLDGDCAVDPEFARRAMPEFQDNRIAVVFGRLRERHRDRGLYDRVVEMDRTNPPPGPTLHCGGIAIIRRSALEAVNGFAPELIAGEDNDVCVRMRNLGLVVLRIEAPMAEHELGMQRLSQYCIRTFRSGYGFAELSHRHRGRQVWIVEQIGISSIWGILLLLLLLSTAIDLIYWRSWIPLALTLVVTIPQALGVAWRSRRKSSDRVACLLSGFFWVGRQVPALCGQGAFWMDRLAGRKREWISYK